MTDEEKMKPLIVEIRKLAGQIGILEKMEWPGAADSSEYDFQVRCGLSTTVVQILDFEIGALMQFHRYCLASFIDPDNERVAALLDALQNEIEHQMDSEEEVD